MGLGPTLLMVLATAILGVHLLKKQGLHTWQQIQTQLAQGQVPAMAMASAAQLLFAGGLLLTPGFVTDTIGFLLLIPAVRYLVAAQMLKRWTSKASNFQATYSHTANYSYHTQKSQQQSSKYHSHHSGRTVEGDYEDQSPH